MRPSDICKDKRIESQGLVPSLNAHAWTLIPAVVVASVILAWPIALWITPRCAPDSGEVKDRPGMRVEGRRSARLGPYSAAMTRGPPTSQDTRSTGRGIGVGLRARLRR